MAMELCSGVMMLTDAGLYPARINQDETAVQASVFILSCQHSGEKIWIIMAGKGSAGWVNGRFLQAGVRVLQDRDEVRINHKPSVFFSTEELARVVPFPAGPSPVFCPRCKQPLADGTPSVQCPRCSVWHHSLWPHNDEANSLGCWEYSAACAICDQQTDLHSGFRWTPLEL